MATRLYDAAAVARARRRLPTDPEAARLDRVRRALCEPLRVRIIKALGSEELCVNDLAATIERPPEVASQHLRVLRQLGVVEPARRGRIVFYRLTDEGVRQFAPVLGDIERRMAR